MTVGFPAYWWGRSSTQLVTPTISIPELVRQHVMSADLAGLLWGLLARRASCLAVAGHYSGAGKTTTLTALTSCYPANTEFVVARGRSEDFSFVEGAAADRTAVLVPEFSNHTPAYVWGPAAARVFHLRGAGFTFAGTMHGNSVEEVLAELQRPPVSLMPSEIAKSLQIILIQNIIEEIGERRVQGVSWVYHAPRGPAGLGVKGLASWNPRDDLWHLFSSPETWDQLAAWANTDAPSLRREVEARTAFVTRLAEDRVTDFSEVDQRLRSFKP